MTALTELRRLRNKQKAIENRINEIAEQAAQEAQKYTESGKFTYRGHEYVLDHVDFYRVKCMD